VLRALAAADGCIVLPSDAYVDGGHSRATLPRPALEGLRDRVAQVRWTRANLEFSLNRRENAPPTLARARSTR
jgi:hypothetical protein